jgi:1-acyl-sn-glycerol-3-phosphate acyltransferase
MAIKTGAPIIPVSVVGAEETYIALRRMPFLSQLTGYPIPPISLRWPWLGPLGLVPLPTKWYIDFGEQVPMEAYVPNESENLILVTQLTNQVRNEIQSMVYKRLSLRQSIFFGK